MNTKRKRCPNGSRKNRKTGECESKGIRKRCPNGTRKNRKTGECIKKPAPVIVKPITYMIFHSKSKDVLNTHELPKDAMRRLSNFSLDSVEYDGHVYPTVEHAYQAQKYACSNKPELIHMFYDGTIDTPEKAKTAGGKGGMKKYGASLDFTCWSNSKSEDIMQQLIQSKVKRNSHIREIIKKLRSENVHVVHFSRTDMVWGAHMNPDKTEIIRGENKLGKIYNTIHV